jgi:hypothetical protein
MTRPNASTWKCSNWCCGKKTVLQLAGLLSAPDAALPLTGTAPWS